MERTVAIVAIVLIACVACAAESAPGAPSSMTVLSPPMLPASALPTMESQADEIDAEGISIEATHPEELRSLLEESGFAAGSQRSFSGGKGAFSRILARGLAFTTDEGAAAYVAWFEAHAPEEIIAAERISPRGLPEGVVAFVHEPSGCCHNEVPSYLAAWSRGSSVLYVSAAGRRATTRAFVDIVRAYDEVA